MQKSDYFQEKKLNPADELRGLLNSLENREHTVKSLDATQSLILLRDLDQAYALLDALEETGLNLRPEQARFMTVQAHYKKNVAKIFKALGGPEALSEYRPTPPPDRKRWWWYMGEIVVAQKRHSLRRIGLALVTIVITVGAIIIAFNTFLAPSPEAVARVEAESESLAAFEEGDYELALAALDEGLTVVPDDPGLLIIKGILLEILGEDKEAAQSFEQAQAGFDDQAAYHFGRGQLYLRTNRYVEAEEEARAAIELNDNLSAAWLLLGQSLEAQDKRFEAIPAYQQAGEVALANGDSEIVVLARLALSRVGLSP